MKLELAVKFEFTDEFSEELEFAEDSEMINEDKDAAELKVLDEDWRVVFEAAFACCVCVAVFLV